MQPQKLYIKGMVCDRCIRSVRNKLQELGIEVEKIDLGEVTLSNPLEVDRELVDKKLVAIGFSLRTDKKEQQVKDIKAAVARVYSGDFDFKPGFRFALYVAHELASSYDKLSNSFSEVEQSTIEKYIINYRIEQIKEALVYTEKTLADLSFSLGFSSVAHLSKQFKLNTGLTPSYFRSIKSIKDHTKINAAKK